MPMVLILLTFKFLIILFKRKQKIGEQQSINRLIDRQKTNNYLIFRDKSLSVVTNISKLSEPLFFFFIIIIHSRICS